MPIEIRPMRASDLLARDRVFRAAFTSGLRPYIYPHGETDADITHTLRQNLKTLDKLSHSDDEAGHRLMIAYDTEAAPVETDYEFPEGFDECEGDRPEGRVVGGAVWVLQPRHRSQQELDAAAAEPATPAPSANAKLLEVFYGALGAGQAKNLAGNPHVYLKILAVDPEYQRRGVGTKLLAYGLQLADKLGLPAYLEASVVGRPLYNRVGFEDVGWLEGFDVRDFGGREEVRFMCMLRPAVEMVQRGRDDGEGQ